jgi:hypothetical protein
VLSTRFITAPGQRLETARKLLENSGRHFRLVLVRLTQYVAPAPHRFDVVLAVRRAGELLAQLKNEALRGFWWVILTVFAPSNMPKDECFQAFGKRAALILPGFLLPENVTRF